MDESEKQAPATRESGRGPEVTETQQLVRAALLLAVALVVQGLRFVLPLPGLVTMFVIGTVVNACLVLTVRRTRLRLAAVSSLLLPMVAYMQGQLALAPMIAIVFAGNLVLCLVAHRLHGWRLYLAGPLLKTLFLWAGTGLVLNLLHLGGPVAHVMQLMMSWPQLVTAFLGILLAEVVDKYAKR